MSEPWTPGSERPRVTIGDADDIVDAEIVEDDVAVARDAQDEVSDRSAVEGDRERSEIAFADILEDDLMTVEQLDDDGELEEVLEPTGDMVPVEAAAAAISPAAAATSPAPGAAVAPAGAAPAGPAPAGEETEIECPGCGLTVVGVAPRPSAEWFCPRCDYPLFLVRRQAPPAAESATRGARRRLPGTSGRALSAAAACWNCGEWNEAGIAACLRCAATLPKPEAPKVPAEVVPPEVQLVEVEVMYWPPVWISALGGMGSGMVLLWAVLTALGRL